MGRYIIACSLIITIPTLGYAGCPCQRGQESFSAHLKTRLESYQADVSITQRLFSYGIVNEQGDDAQLRPRYVGTQGLVEQILAQELASGRLKKVIAVIHTPLPATPLCTEGEVTPDLVDPAILRDEKRLQTVRERPALVRALLQSGGVLMAAYPAQARVQRSTAQLAVFDQLLSKYPQRLFDAPLSCAEISPAMVGATYLFESTSGEWFVYSVRFTQAIAPGNPTYASMWFGSVNEGPASIRLVQVAAYLRSCQGPDLMAYLK